MSDFVLAQCSDLHLNYKATRRVNAQGVNIREVDGYLAFAKIVSEIIEERCDAALFCGDTFHTPTPSMRAIVFAQNQFRRLANAGVKVYILSGNHDVMDEISNIAASRVLHDPDRGIYSHAEPYVHHEIGDGIHIHMVSHHMYSAQAETMNLVKPIESEINIFSTHGSCIDPLLKEKLHTNQSPREIVIPEFLLSDQDWSYTLLGHIHERGWVGSRDKKTDTANKKIYYNGSLIRRGFSDKQVPLGCGWTKWTIGSDGIFKADPKTVPQRPQRDFTPIKTEDLTAAEITEKIIENLKTTQIHGTEFNPKIAPILRQQILNITPAKFASLNWNAIHQNSEHALQWAISQVKKTEESESNSVSTEVDVDSVLNGGDIVQIYDNWIKKSELLKDMKDDDLETITAQAKKYLKLGQETTLEAE
mgnify:CR=1 FL=1